MKTYVWLIFDLGVQGDYDGLFSWLDEHEAKDCGNNAAFFYFNYSGDVASELREAIKKSVKVTAKTRLYAIHGNPKGGGPLGHFILGGRKAPPWAGFAPQAPGKPDVPE